MAPQSSSDINQVFRKPPEIRNGLKPVVIYTLYAVELAVHKTFSGASQLGIYFKTRKNIKNGFIRRIWSHQRSQTDLKRQYLQLIWSRNLNCGCKTESTGETLPDCLVDNDKIYILGWTYPLKVLLPLVPAFPALKKTLSLTDNI